MSLTKSQLIELQKRWDERSDYINRITVESVKRESDAERERRIKFLLLPENYGKMFNYYFGKDSEVPLADCDCAWYHTAIYQDCFENAFKTIFNAVYRGGAKSTHANCGYIHGLKQNDKAKFFLVVGANEVRSAMLLQDLQLQYSLNKRIIADFGSQKVYGHWADGIFETTDKATFMSLGIDQPFRGLRANSYRVEYASIDDVEDKQTAKNKMIVRETVDKITADLQGAFSKRSERTMVNNNYFVTDGVVERLMKKKGIDIKKFDTKRGFIHRDKFVSAYFVNLTTEYFDKLKTSKDWQPNWPERNTKSDCLRKVEQYEHDVETLSGEFYNTPINAGKRFKEEWIKMVDCPDLSAFDFIVVNWDLAYGNEACYKGGAFIGVKGINITVIDIFCRQTDIEIALQYHFSACKKIAAKNGALMLFYDASVAQESVYEPVWLRAAKRYKSIHIPMPQKSSTDKYTKIDTTLSSVFVSGLLSFDKRIEQNPDWEEGKRQILNFEKGSKYPVDLPDALTDAIIQAQEYMQADYGEDDDAYNKPVFGKKRNKGY